MNALRSGSFLSMAYACCLGVAACGGSVESGGYVEPQQRWTPSAVPDESGTSTSTTKPLDLEGSFDVVFSTVTLAGTNFPSRPEPPSRTIPLRLDLGREGTKLVAVITSRWGTPSSVKVTESPNALTLEGDVSVVAPTAPNISVTDHWKKWSLPRNPDGTLTGAMRVEGTQFVFQGDTGGESTLMGEARFERDVTKPQLRMRLRSPHGPSDKLLPWDRVVVEAAEPLEAVRLRAALSVTQGSAALPLAWETSSPNAADWSGVTSIAARATAWPSGGAPHVVSSSPLSDRAGLTTDGGALGAPFNFVSLGAPTSVVSWDDDIVYGSTWGTTEILGGGLIGSSDPRCESGGCLKLVRGSINSCGSSSAGIAAKLTRGAQGKVKVRYRVLAQPKFDSPSGPSLYVPVLNVELAAETGAVIDTDVRLDAGNGFVKLASPIDQFGWATTWLTTELDAPPGGGLGVALTPEGATPFGCGGMPYPEVEMVVLIESVQSL